MTSIFGPRSARSFLSVLFSLALVNAAACGNDDSSKHSSNVASGTASTDKEWVGWLIDTDCVGANPATHTQSCNLMPTCIDSGFGIYVYEADKDYKSYVAADWIPFDISSQALAKQLNWVLSEPNDKTAHLQKYVDKIPTIKVTGRLVSADNIVIDPDLDRDPSTAVTLSSYGDWTEAIHIQTLEFHYIDGVSNFEVTSPENVVLDADATVD